MFGGTGYAADLPTGRQGFAMSFAVLRSLAVLCGTSYAAEDREVLCDTLLLSGSLRYKCIPLSCPSHLMLKITLFLF